MIAGAEREKNEMDQNINKLQSKIEKENHIKGALAKKQNVIKEFEEMQL
jgi:hypothetical protein